MVTEQAVFVVWELLLDGEEQEKVDSPLTVNVNDVYIRRFRFVHWRGCQFWTSWPASVRGRGDLDPRLTEARLSVCTNPHLIITGMTSIAETLGLLVQLDKAIARTICILSGLLKPLQPPSVGSNPTAGPFYVAMTTFGNHTPGTGIFN